MTATISWEWMSLLVNRGNCALKFWVIEFVKVIVLPYNTICRFRGGCNLQKGRTTMKLPPSPPLTANRHTQTHTLTTSLTQFPISHCFWHWRSWLREEVEMCDYRPRMIFCSKDTVEMLPTLCLIILTSLWPDLSGFKYHWQSLSAVRGRLVRNPHPRNNGHHQTH